MIPNLKLQIDRLVFFSDAVIAIAITLLIIEIKAPHLSEYTGNEGLEKLYHEYAPKFVSFLISFFVIAIYWKAHHNLFGYLTSFTDQLIWINILFLLGIVLMPFSSAFYSENYASSIAYTTYCLNIIFTGIINCWLVRYISSSKKNISSLSGNHKWTTYYTLRSVVAPLVFAISLLISFYSIVLSRFAFILIFPIIYLLGKFFPKEKMVE